MDHDADFCRRGCDPALGGIILRKSALYVLWCVHAVEHGQSQIEFGRSVPTVQQAQAILGCGLDRLRAVQLILCRGLDRVKPGRLFRILLATMQSGELLIDPP